MSISLLALFVHSIVRAVEGGSYMYRNIKFCSHCNFYISNFTLFESANFINLSALLRILTRDKTILDVVSFTFWQPPWSHDTQTIRSFEFL